MFLLKRKYLEKINSKTRIKRSISLYSCETKFFCFPSKSVIKRIWICNKFPNPGIPQWLFVLFSIEYSLKLVFKLIVLKRLGFKLFLLFYLKLICNLDSIKIFQYNFEFGLLLRSKEEGFYSIYNFNWLVWNEYYSQIHTNIIHKSYKDSSFRS